MLEKFTALFLALMAMIGGFFALLKNPARTVKSPDENTILWEEAVFIRGKSENMIWAENCPVLITCEDPSISNIIAGLETGDRVRVTFYEILETYPARGKVKSLQIIEKGGNIKPDESVLTELKDLGLL